jgi:sortase (surface protein transpeptidase)
VLELKRPYPRAAPLTGAAAIGLAGAIVLGIGLSGAQERTAAVGEAAPTTTEAAPATSAMPVAATPSATPSPTSTPPPAARHTPSSSVHLVIPSVDLDLPLLALTARRGVIDPPLLTAGYWIEPYGEPVGTADQAVNTLYIAAHSAGRGDDGFDPLLTADHRGSALAAGDTVDVRTPNGTVTYTVERTQRYGKNELAAATDVWEASPGRLVLITCFQRADGRSSTENLVVFAES